MSEVSESGFELRTTGAKPNISLLQFSYGAQVKIFLLVSISITQTIIFPTVPWKSTDVPWEKKKCFVEKYLSQHYVNICEMVKAWLDS